MPNRGFGSDSFYFLVGPKVPNRGFGSDSLYFLVGPKVPNRGFGSASFYFLFLFFIFAREAHASREIE